MSTRGSAEAAEALAARILAAGDWATSMPPVTDARPDFDLLAAYRVADIIMRQRIDRGERVVGWKIGFTNRTIWDEYAVRAPIWGPLYSTTTAPLSEAPTVEAQCLAEPRIEPEIAFRLRRRPEPGMDEAALLACIDAVAHGFEIVQSIYPAWRFRAADTIAAFALHGRYRHGMFVAIADGDRAAWLHALGSFGITLFRNGAEIDHGQAENVLGGPLSALRHFVDALPQFPMGREIEAGDLVTTGTLTRAFPVAPGEHWTTRIERLPLDGISLTLV